MSRPRGLQPGADLTAARLDDLAGSLDDLARLLRGLEARGLRLRFGGDLAGLSEAESRALIQGVLMAADFHARALAERLRADEARARQDGCFRSGRPRTLDPQRVADLRAEGLGATAIAARLGVTRTSVYRKLKEIEAPETRRLKAYAASPNCSDASRA